MLAMKRLYLHMERTGLCHSVTRADCYQDAQIHSIVLEIATCCRPGTALAMSGRLGGPPWHWAQ